ncbi:MAG: NUDIX domain-containing protein [Pseudomonadota bacterium]
MSELLEIYDAGGASLGLKTRSEVHQTGALHKAVHVFLFRSDRKLLIQQRSSTKDVSPSLWDLSAAEHLQPGETFEAAAIRGVREELGIHLVAVEPVGEPRTFRLTLPEQGINDHEQQMHFKVITDELPRIAEDEVSDIIYVTRDELTTHIERNTLEITPWFRDSLPLLMATWGSEC